MYIITVLASTVIGKKESGRSRRFLNFKKAYSNNTIIHFRDNFNY